MPIPEIENFRKKYPDYSDLDDTALADRLAAKFPDAYGDLPAKVKSTMAFPDIPEKDSFLAKTVSNIIPSAVKMGTDIAGMVTSPVQTVKGLGKLAVGATQKAADVLIPESIRQQPPAEEDYRAQAEAVGQHFAERYGGWENLKKTISEDPVGFVTDLSSILTGGGAAAAKIPGIAKAAQKVSKAGAIIEPLNIAKRGIALGAKLVPESIPSKLYQSGAKFSSLLTREERARLVKTAFDEEILPSIKGVDKARGIIDNLKGNIEGLVDNATVAGHRMQVADLFKDFQALQDAYSLSGKPLSNQKIINHIRNEIEQGNLLAGRTGLTPRQAQTLKQKIYKDLESYYEQMKSAPAAVAAQKTVARAAKEYLESIIPEIKKLNAREGAMIELKDVIERASSRIMNRDLLGIGVPIKVGAGTLGGPTGAAAGLALGILDTPAVKARIAMTLNRLKHKGIKVNPSAAMMRLGVMEAAEVIPQQEE